MFLFVPMIAPVDARPDRKCSSRDSLQSNARAGTSGSWGLGRGHVEWLVRKN